MSILRQICGTKKALSRKSKQIKTCCVAGELTDKYNCQFFYRKEYLREKSWGAIMKQKLTQAELEAALNNLPPVMTPIEAAMLLRLKLSTLYRHVSEGKYSSAVKRGKPLRFWRDRLVQEFML